MNEIEWESQIWSKLSELPITIGQPNLLEQNYIFKRGKMMT